MRIGHLHRLGLLGLLTSLCACGSGGSGGGVVFAQSGYFRVTHVQAVQAVQTLDNGMPLVAYKPTYVRVFLDGYQGAHGPWRVSARLTVRDVDTNAEHDLFPISFDPNFAITVTPSGSHPDRWNDSFTFVLDYGDTAPGARVFTARAFSGPDVSNPSGDHVRSLEMTFFPAVSKSAYGVLFAETEIDHDHEEVPVSPVAPWSDFEGHRRFVESAYPVTHFGIQPLPGIGKAAPNPQPFTTITGANTWAFAMLANLPAGSKMYVLEPWATPGVHGYAWGTGLAEGENARDGRIGIVMAQEMAHVYGNWCHTFDETPCNYPRKSGWIDSEDTGFNLSGNYGKPLELVSRIGERDALNVLDEQLTISDFMSYNAAPAWISSFTSCQLIHLLWPNNVPTVCIPGVRPTVAATPPPAPFAAPQAYLLVAGRFGTAGGATIDLVEPIPSSEDVSTPQEWTTSHSVRVLDAMGRSLLDFPFLANHSDHDEGTHFAYSVVLPFEQVRANAAAVALLDATGTPLARWDLPTASPVVRTLTGPSPVPGTNLVSGKKTVTWTADDPAGRALKCTLLYSADGGVRWWPLNTGLSGTSAVVDFDAVPGSEAAMLKIRASNGGRWAEAVTTVPFRVARQAPEVAIVQPDTDVALGARESLLLQGRAFTWEDGDLNGPGALTWSTDTGPLGSGSWVVVRSLRSGPHVITLQATAPDGRTAKTTVTVIVGTN